jgi:hypothetical protein
MTCAFSKTYTVHHERRSAYDLHEGVEHAPLDLGDDAHLEG